VTAFIDCPLCLRRSHSAGDVQHRFCVTCGFHDRIPEEMGAMIDNARESLAARLRRLLPQSVDWLVQRGYARRVVEDEQEGLEITEKGAEYFDDITRARGRKHMTEEQTEKRVRIGEKMPQLRELADKMKNDVRTVAEMNIVNALDNVLPESGDTDTFHRVAASISLTGAAVAATIQMLTISMAAARNGPVSTAQALLFSLMNDGTVHLQGVLDKADALIKLANENGFDIKTDRTFDPIESMRRQVQGVLDGNPRAAAMLREEMERDPVIREMVEKVGIDLNQKEEQGATAQEQEGQNQADSGAAESGQAGGGAGSAKT
jgi:Zn ribbon nucleic-acid-binding protein